MLRYGLIGCGNISREHIKAAASFALEEKLEIAAFCDILPERTQSAAQYASDLLASRQSLAPRRYTDLETMLEREQLDILAICTPSGYHPEHGICAARHHVHVLTEKPMGVTLESADRLIRACEESGVRLFVVKQNRLNATNRLLLDMVEKQRFGSIYLIQSNVFWHRGQTYYNSAAWRGTRELDGGAFMNQAIHYADMMQLIGGSMHSVIAAAATLNRKMEMEDTGSAIVHFESGAMGSLNVTMLAMADCEGSLTVLGENGTVKLSGVAMNRIETWEFRDKQPLDDAIKQNSYTPDNVYGFGHAAFYGKMLDTLYKGEPVFVDGREGRKSLELICGIYESVQTGKAYRFEDFY